MLWQAESRDVCVSFMEATRNAIDNVVVRSASRNDSILGDYSECSSEFKAQRPERPALMAPVTRTVLVERSTEGSW
jgi:hypothetical protein